ncbi:hypothetical protein [Parvularcula oceani]|uniref:hypothetical protein n=1 Tax=Parvularcula oceani TaxID=1247963 RepID=UPI0004E0B5DA|nr:hypothetical protein [Parvularcula oceani]
MIELLAQSALAEAGMTAAGQAEDGTTAQAGLTPLLSRLALRESLLLLAPLIGTLLLRRRR